MKKGDKTAERFGWPFILDMHPGHNRRCHCTSTEFDVDDFGRVFYPDHGRFCTVVLDTNGNEITTVGGYGNQDDARDRIASAPDCDEEVTGE